MMRLNLLLFGGPGQNNAPANNLRENSPMTLTVQQMAKSLNISRNVAYDLTREPGFPCFRLGKRILINRELLQEWLNRQCKNVS